MNPRTNTSRHEEDAQRYLDSVGPHFVQGAKIFEPNSYTQTAKREVEVKATISDQRAVQVRPRDSIATAIIAVANSLSTVISLGTLIGLIFTVKIAQRQWKEMSETTDASRISAGAALDSAETANASLKVTRDVFKASQVAILHSSQGFQATGLVGYLQVNIGNLGHLPATRVHGDITFAQTLPTGRAEQVQHFSRSVISTDYLTRTFLLGEPLNLDVLKKRDVRVSVNISYFNGIEEIPEHFCSALISQQYGGEQWEDCENKKAFQPK